MARAVERSVPAVEAALPVEADGLHGRLDLSVGCRTGAQAHEPLALSHIAEWKDSWKQGRLRFAVHRAGTRAGGEDAQRGDGARNQQRSSSNWPRTLHVPDIGSRAVGLRL